MNILGIETSCDDTSASIVANGKQILSNVAISQDEFHRQYKGIVPEVASRKHLETLLPVIDEALRLANLKLKELDAIAVTTHPGLMGALLVGVNTAKGLAYSQGLPLIGVNHLSAHLYALSLSNEVNYPLIGLIVSGGHTLLVKASDPLTIDIIGTTIDDACGECFDKVAKYFELGYPGGPAIDKLSQNGDEHAIPYPIFKSKGDNKYNFSYSGLKTAVIYQTEKICSPKKGSVKIEDISASFQKAAITPLVKKALLASEEFNIKTIGICGGVSANSYLRKLLAEVKGIEFIAPELKYCPDNAAMVAGIAYHQALKGDWSNLSLTPSSRPIRGGALSLD